VAGMGLAPIRYRRMVTKCQAVLDEMDIAITVVLEKRVAVRVSVRGRGVGRWLSE